MCYWETELGESYQGLLETYYILLYISDYIMLVDVHASTCMLLMPTHRIYPC